MYKYLRENAIDEYGVCALQDKILEIMTYIDEICRKNDITYYIMGGSALGAVRHGGFIPWDDDLDIFMTPSEYQRFKLAFEKETQTKFVIQEWRVTPKYLEYAKVRMNGTTFIEKQFSDRQDMHHGIYVDIMILHKVPNRKLTQKIVYYKSKYVTLYALSKRNWKPKTKAQKLALKILKLLPNKLLVKSFYKHIYKYDDKNDNFKYCYWITPAKFENGLFDKKFFGQTCEYQFEKVKLLGAKEIKKYLEYRYGNYMELPPLEKRKSSTHAWIFDTEKNYSEYLEK